MWWAVTWISDDQKLPESVTTKISYIIMASAGLSKLTLNILNCFEDYKRFIHISYHILDFIQQKKTTFAMGQHYMLSILYCQYHTGWCPGDLSRQGISRQGLTPRNIPSLAWEELMQYHVFKMFLPLSLCNIWGCVLSVDLISWWLENSSSCYRYQMGSMNAEI